MNSPSYAAYAAAKPLATVLLAAALGAVVGVAVSKMLPSGAKASLAFTVAQQARQETADYAYDGYYALRATELVSDTLISWFATPSVLQEIHDGAGIALTPDEALAAAGRAFRARKYSGQNVVVSFAAPDEDAARRLAASAATAVAARSEALALSAQGETLFRVTASAPVVARDVTDPRAAAVAGAGIGAFLGLALARSVRNKKSPSS